MKKESQNPKPLLRLDWLTDCYEFFVKWCPKRGKHSSVTETEGIDSSCEEGSSQELASVWVMRASMNKEEREKEREREGGRRRLGEEEKDKSLREGNQVSRESEFTKVPSTILILFKS